MNMAEFGVCSYCGCHGTGAIAKDFNTWVDGIQDAGIGGGKLCLHTAVQLKQMGLKDVTNAGVRNVAGIGASIGGAVRREG